MPIPVQTLPPDPPPMPPTTPGIAPPPQLPPMGGAPGGAPPPGAAPSGAGAPPPPAGQLIPGGPPPAAGAAPPGAPPPDSGDPGASGDDIHPRLIPGSDATSGLVPASPQEQQDLQQTLIKAGNMIHSRQSRDQVLSSLHDPQATVSQAVGRTAASILMTIDGQKQAVGQGALDHDVLMEAAKHVIPELMDIGISSGIFPMKPPPASASNDPSQGPGVGSDPYNRAIRMALLEATKIYGQQQLQRPDAHVLTQQAQNDWADGVRREVASGTASPKYMAIARPQSQGQPALINQPAPDPGGAGAASGAS